MKFLSFISDNGTCWKLAISDDGNMELSIMEELEIESELTGDRE